MEKIARYTKVAERIRRHMDEQGIKAARLSTRAGLERNYVRSVLRGLTEPDRIFIPKIEKLRKIARVLGVATDYLAGLTDDPAVGIDDLVPANDIERRILAGLRGMTETEQSAVLTIVERGAADPPDRLLPGPDRSAGDRPTAATRRNQAGAGHT